MICLPASPWLRLGTAAASPPSAPLCKIRRANSCSLQPDRTKFLDRCSLTVWAKSKKKKVRRMDGAVTGCGREERDGKCPQSDQRLIFCRLQGRGQDSERMAGNGVVCYVQGCFENCLQHKEEGAVAASMICPPATALPPLLFVDPFSLQTAYAQRFPSSSSPWQA